MKFKYLTFISIPVLFKILFIVCVFGQILEANTDSLIEKGALNKFNTNITIWTEKSIYLVQEIISVNFKIENFEEPGPFISGIIQTSLIIQDSKGNILPATSSLSYNDIKSMKKGEIRSFEGSINWIYGIYNGFESIFPADNYRITCSWKEGDGYEPIVSNTIEIVVKEPTGQELGALQLYREALKYQDQKEYQTAADKYEELTIKYPNSVYGAQALNNKLFILYFIKNDEAEIIKTNRKILENYPNSRYIEKAIEDLNSYYQYYNNPQGEKQYFDSLYQTTESIKLKQTIKEYFDKIDKDQ